MDRPRAPRRRARPLAEPVEPRLLLSLPPDIRSLLSAAPAFRIARPNTPVAPFGAASNPTFVDPYARVLNGKHAVIGTQSYVGPFATIDTTSGFVKVGSGSDILDNALLSPNPGRLADSPALFVGDKVSIGFGARVLGPARIGAYGAAAQPTAVGPNALIDGATIAPGAVVGALAYVGPGVTVPAGVRVLDGKAVRTDAEASDPALGKVVRVVAADLTRVSSLLAANVSLAAGYTQLYQGQSATGASPGVAASVTNVFNGNLAAVSGASQEPGPPTATQPAGVSFEPGRFGPRFPSPRGPLVEGDIPTYPARVTGLALFQSRARTVAGHLGRGNAIRADDGQPIGFVAAPTTGRGVTINAPLGAPRPTTGTTTSTPSTSIAGSNLLIGSGVQVGDGAVILGGPAPTPSSAANPFAVGNDVTVGSGAVVDRSTLGAGSVVGARSYVAQSTLAPGTVVPPGAVIIGGKQVGVVEW